MLRDREKARKCFAEAIEQNPDDSYAHHQLGLLLEDEFGDVQGAEQCYRAAVEANPRNFCAWSSLGLLVKKRDQEEGLRLMERALEIEPTYSRALKNIGIIYMHHKKDFAKAEEYFNRAIECDAQNASAYILRGQLEELRPHGDLSVAERCYDAAIAADKWNPTSYARMGIINLHPRRRDARKAKQYLEQALQIDPTDVRSAHRLCRLEESEGRFEAARNLMLRTLEACPRDVSVQRSLQFILRNHFADDMQSRELLASLQVDSSSSSMSTWNSRQSFSMDERSSSFGTLYSKPDSNFGEESAVQCPQGHALVKVSAKPSTYTPHSTWACEECKKSIGGAGFSLHGALYCRLCKYSLCHLCKALENRTAHLMPQAPKLLGQGTFGTVMKEFDPQLKGYVAVKHVSKMCVTAALDVRREVELMKRFDDNPNVVRVHRYEEAEHEVRIVMELMVCSVSDVVAEKGALHESVARTYIRDALRGLHALHTAQRPHVHRDIKPANLLLSPVGRVKVSDFGLSKPMAAQTMMNTRALKGTPLMMAPELFGSPPRWSPASDIWAIACTFISLVSGRAPYASVMESAKCAPETIGFQFMTNANFSPAIPEFMSPDAQRWVRAALSVDPQARPSAAELLAAPYFSDNVTTEALRRQMEPADAYAARAAALVAEAHCPPTLSAQSSAASSVAAMATVVDSEDAGLSGATPSGIPQRTGEGAAHARRAEQRGHLGCRMPATMISDAGPSLGPTAAKESRGCDVEMPGGQHQRDVRSSLRASAPSPPPPSRRRIWLVVVACSTMALLLFSSVRS